MLVVDQLKGQLIKAKDALFADRVMHSKAKLGPWETMDLLVQQWMESNPNKYDSFIVDTKEKQDTRTNRYGSNKARTLRSVVDFPQPIHNRIRAIYKADELPFDKEFFHKFWKRYPQFRVAESL